MMKRFLWGFSKNDEGDLKIQRNAIDPMNHSVINSTNEDNGNVAEPSLSPIIKGEWFPKNSQIMKIKMLKKEAKMPSYGRDGDAGMDMYALETIMIEPMGMCRIDHGFALEIPNGHVGLVKDKGSMANKGLHTMGGVFDSGYRGEYNTIVINLSNRPVMIEEGSKVSQLVIVPFVSAVLNEVDQLSESERGEGRFGSTGK